MSGAADEAAVPRLRRGVKFRHDPVRDAWVLLAPERLFQPDATAVEVLKLVDGARTLGAIIDDLAARFAAPRDLIAADVAALLRDLGEKGAIEF
ncbi:MAG: pyrroloquinoline quinone biosynthesis peptide chaperone PqqD [Rhodospirillales bacterium]|nr:pyrroloquinoline quinone biosynthesis peptide chaperone PqqD [Rhodospirillales bacterium]